MIAFAQPDEPRRPTPHDDAATPAPASVAAPLHDRAAELAVIGHLVDGDAAKFVRLMHQLRSEHFADPLACAAFLICRDQFDRCGAFVLIDYLQNWVGDGHSKAYPEASRCFVEAAAALNVDAAMMRLLRTSARREVLAIAESLTAAAVKDENMLGVLFDETKRLDDSMRRLLRAVQEFFHPA